MFLELDVWIIDYRLFLVSVVLAPHPNVVYFLIPAVCTLCIWYSSKERNYGFTRSIRPITVRETTTICKNQLEATIENPGNAGGADFWYFWSLVHLQRPFVVESFFLCIRLYVL